MCAPKGMLLHAGALAFAAIGCSEPHRLPPPLLLPSSPAEGAFRQEMLETSVPEIQVGGTVQYRWRCRGSTGIAVLPFQGRGAAG